MDNNQRMGWTFLSDFMEKFVFQVLEIGYWILADEMNFENSIYEF